MYKLDLEKEENQRSNCQHPLDHRKSKRVPEKHLLLKPLTGWITTNWKFFKIIRDTKGTFHAKMGSIKDRNGLDLTEAEDIKKRRQNTQKNCIKKIFTTKIIMMV